MNIKRTVLAAASGLAILGACKDSMSVGDLNNVTEEVAQSLTRSSLQLLATGLLDSDRGDLDKRYLIFAGTMARDFVRFDPAESRWVIEMVGAFADPSAFTGGGVWTQFFVTVRTAHTILNGIPSASGFSAAELSATSGLVKTIKAQALYRTLEMRDSVGMPIDVNRGINDELAPFVCKPNVLAYISALLDSAYAELQAGGSEFPFVMPPGFDTPNGAFDTPATFALFNRGLKGKVEVYRGLSRERPDAGAFDRAIAALNASFLDTLSGNLEKGPYYTFSTAPGETLNPLSDVAIHLNRQVGDSIQIGDLRAAKIRPCTSGCSRHSVTTVYDYTYAQPSGATLVRSIPILKNAELILLRAQAQIGKGNLVAAAADINYVRRVDGGLPPAGVPVVGFLSQADAITALLYEKRYSLLGEGAQRLVDLRAYDRLRAPYHVKELPADVFQQALPVPTSESNARKGDVAPTCS